MILYKYVCYLIHYKLPLYSDVLFYTFSIHDIIHLWDVILEIAIIFYQWIVCMSYIIMGYLYLTIQNMQENKNVCLLLGPRHTLSRLCDRIWIISPTKFYMQMVQLLIYLVWLMWESMYTIGLTWKENS